MNIKEVKYERTEKVDKDDFYSAKEEIALLREALLDLIDDNHMYDLADMTGNSPERCEEIIDLAHAKKQNE